jgi:hypothetical protein
MRQFSLYLIFFFVSHALPLLGQDAFDSISTRLIRKYSNSPPEIIYLQTSKDIYETGEDLWFKAYQLDAHDHYLSTGSKTLYLQVVNGSDSVVWQEKYPLVNGIADGHVYLDEKLPEGSYTLEAYTGNSFYNDSSVLSSIRKILVVKRIGNVPEQKESKPRGGFRFEVFPEGGNLVSGIPSQLAFKGTDGKGSPIDISGELLENGSPLARFMSQHDGMGRLAFTPSAGKTYRLKLATGQDYPLPHIQANGLSLHLAKQGEEFVEFKVYQSDGMPEQDIYVLGQMGGVPRCMVRAVIRDSLKIRIPIRESDFPVQGIAEFTLFDKDENPVAERLVCVHPDKELNISATFDKKIYTVKNKVELKLKVTDEKGNPTIAHLGVSIFDKAYYDSFYPVNIQTHCLLSSQIRGNIHNPYYYFNKKNIDRKEALDLLLMTQGWRRYAWKYVKGEENSGNRFLNDGMRGTQAIKKAGLRNTEQMIQVFDAKEQSGFIWTDTLGHFSIDPEILHRLRGGYLYLKPLVGKEYRAKLELEDPFKSINSIRSQKQRYCPFINTSLVKYDPIGREQFINQFGTILLKEVSVSAKSHKPLRDKYMGKLDSLAQVHLGAWVCDCNIHPVPSFLNDYLEGYTHHPDGIKGHQYKKKSLPVKGKTYELIKYVPGGPKGSWYVEDIKTIVYQGPEYSDEELLRMNNLWRIKGYYGQRKFYMPDKMEMFSSLPDTRNTLLWNPSVITDDKGEATLDFYTSDLNTGFVGRIEGIGDNGLLGVSQVEFHVIKHGQMK